MKKLLLTLALAIGCSWILTAADAPKEPTLEQRVADIEAYMNNGARTPDVASKVAGPGPGHNAWQMTSTALVLFMTLPGLALFYGGLVRSKNVLSILAMCMGVAGLVTILWWAVGYSLTFSGGNAFIGDTDRGRGKAVGYVALVVFQRGRRIPIAEIGLQAGHALFEGGFRSFGNGAESRHHEGGKHQQGAPSNQALHRHVFVSFMWSYTFRLWANPLDKTISMGPQPIKQTPCQVFRILDF